MGDVLDYYKLTNKVWIGSDPCLTSYHDLYFEKSHFFKTSKVMSFKQLNLYEKEKYIKRSCGYGELMSQTTSICKGFVCFAFVF